MSEIMGQLTQTLKEFADFKAKHPEIAQMKDQKRITEVGNDESS